MLAPLVVGLGRIGLAISGLAPTLPGGEAHPAILAAIATAPAPGVAVAVRAAVRLGCRGRVAGSHGADLLGQLARGALRDAGIASEGLRAAGSSSCELAVVAGDGTMRVRYPGDRGTPTVLDVATALTDAAALLVDGSDPDDQLRAAELARSRGVPVIFDVTCVDDGTRALAARSDVVLASEREACELAPARDLRGTLGGLVALGPRAAVITLGSEGALGRHGDQVFECAAFVVDALDGHGAGSVFHGAFAAALLSELPFERCVELAAAAAALSLRELGPWAAAPTRDEVLALVRSRRPS